MLAQLAALRGGDWWQAAAFNLAARYGGAAAAAPLQLHRALFEQSMRAEPYRPLLAHTQVCTVHGSWMGLVL